MPVPSLPFVAELPIRLDPWEAARRLAHRPHLLFLDSADPHPERGRYSYVMANPSRFVLAAENAFDEARALLGETRTIPREDLPPFQGGMAGLWGYGIHRELETIPPNRFDDLPTENLALGRYEWVLAFDLAQSRGWFIGLPNTREVYPEILTLLAAPGVREPISPLVRSRELRAPRHPLPGLVGVSSSFSPDQYLGTIQRAIDYVHAGDVFQVNLAQRLLAPQSDHPLTLYARLRERNPAPFAGYFDAGEFQVISASPERFLRVNAEGEVSTKPIKGTRPRGATPEQDRAYRVELQQSAKDRAENVMIVDLLRNDLGRVCEFGSVRVPRVCELESYRFVHHLVSEVRGHLRADRTPLDLLQAAFPGGSVTGAPKVRAMEVIAELEPTARGPYCGSLGYLGFNGCMDTNILIRTFTASAGWLQFPVGGGIVADSQPHIEYEETLHKAAGLLRALQP
jgi:para-aminobenzoate synthetase component 1